MLTKRIIPCLDCDLGVAGGRVVKGVKFKQIRYAGNPMELAKKYSDEGADELVFLDITASSDRRDTMADVIEKTSEKAAPPLRREAREEFKSNVPPYAEEKTCESRPRAVEKGILMTFINSRLRNLL